MTIDPTDASPADSSSPYESGPDYDAVGEADSDQLTQEDQLLDRGVADLLDEGYVTAEHPLRVGGDAPLTERIAAEEPEVWAPGFKPDREPDRAGRLAEVSDGDRRQVVFAQDVGIDGGASSAEEAAVHVIGEDYVDVSDIDHLDDVDREALLSEEADAESTSESDLSEDESALVDEVIADVEIDLAAAPADAVDEGLL